MLRSVLRKVRNIQSEIECCAFLVFAFDLELTVELMQDLIANGETHANALGVDIFVELLNLPKHFEQLADILLLYTDTCILHTELKSHFR